MAVQPAMAFRSMVSPRAAVLARGKGFDSRAALGLGAGRLGAKGLSDRDGTAFVKAGRALNGIEARRANFGTSGRPHYLWLDAEAG